MGKPGPGNVALAKADEREIDHGHAVLRTSSDNSLGLDGAVGEALRRAPEPAAAFSMPLAMRTNTSRQPICRSHDAVITRGTAVVDQHDRAPSVVSVLVVAWDELAARRVDRAGKRPAA